MLRKWILKSQAEVTFRKSCHITISSVYIFREYNWSFYQKTRCFLPSSSLARITHVLDAGSNLWAACYVYTYSCFGSWSQQQYMDMALSILIEWKPINFRRLSWNQPDANPKRSAGCLFFWHCWFWKLVSFGNNHEVNGCFSEFPETVIKLNHKVCTIAPKRLNLTQFHGKSLPRLNKTHSRANWAQQFLWEKACNISWPHHQQH